MEHTTSTVTVQVITKESPAVPNHPNDVNFEVKYPEGYSGPKNMKEGVTVMSKEVAAMFTERGIGKIVSADAEQTEDKTEGPVDYSQHSLKELKALLTEKGIQFDEAIKKKEPLIELLVSADAEQSNSAV